MGRTAGARGRGTPYSALPPTHTRPGNPTRVPSHKSVCAVRSLSPHSPTPGSGAAIVMGAGNMQRCVCRANCPCTVSLQPRGSPPGACSDGACGRAPQAHIGVPCPAAVVNGHRPGVSAPKQWGGGSMCGLAYNWHVRHCPCRRHTHTQSVVSGTPRSWRRVDIFVGSTTTPPHKCRLPQQSL